MTMQSDLGEQATQVKDTTQEQFHSLMDQGRGEWQKMMEDRSRQAVQGLRRLGDQLSKVANGQADQAPRLQHYVQDAQQRVSGWASRLDEAGFEGMLRDVQQYARRRPGMFLLGAAGTGFVIGRAFRVGASASQQDGAMGSRRSAAFGSYQNGVHGSGSGGWPAGQTTTGTPTGGIGTQGTTTFGTTGYAVEAERNEGRVR